MRGDHVAPTVTASELGLPEWAQVTEKRRAHIARVTNLLDEWAASLGLAASERQAWHDVGVLHDALRDASEEELRRLTRDTDRPMHILHGPAVAERLTREKGLKRLVIGVMAGNAGAERLYGELGFSVYAKAMMKPL